MSKPRPPATIECPTCGHRTSVNWTGRIRRHRVGGQECAGSGVVVALPDLAPTDRGGGP